MLDAKAVELSDSAHCAEKPDLSLEEQSVSSSISVFGLGYVGSVTAACFAHMGHRVVGVDVSPAKVEMMGAGRSPIVEARMSELVAEAHEASRLSATTDSCAAIQQSDISFVCVGTPSLRSGKLDLSHVEHVASGIGSALKRKDSYHVVVLRSTVLPGTTESLVIPAVEKASGKRIGSDFAVCYNPEFMRQASAVADFLNPPYTIVGASHPTQRTLIRELYKSVPGQFFETTIRVAEMVKYVSNVFHAVKVCFANEIGTLCKGMGVDAEDVTRIFTSDTKLNISPAYLSPGFAFGGSCLPKDLRALIYRAKELDMCLPLLEKVLPSNGCHIERAAEAVLRMNIRKVGVLGLSFKTGTDDLRESPLVQLIKRLIGEGLDLRIWDCDVSLGRLVGSNRRYIEEVIPHIGSLLFLTLEEVFKSVDVVLIGTKALNPQVLSDLLRQDQAVI